jgi:hypothetical protein
VCQAQKNRAVIAECYDQVGTRRQFGVPIPTITPVERQEKGPVPTVLVRLAEILEDSGALEILGIFRISAASSETRKWRSSVNQDLKTLEQPELINSPHVVSNLIKMFLHDMPEKLFHNINLLPKRFKTKDDIVEQTLRKLQPAWRQGLFDWLVRFSLRVVELEHANSMGLTNVSTIFSPSLVRHTNNHNKVKCLFIFPIISLVLTLPLVSTNIGRRKFSKSTSIF